MERSGAQNGEPRAQSGQRARRRNVLIVTGADFARRSLPDRYAATCVVCGIWRRPVILLGMTRTHRNLPGGLKVKSKPHRPAIADPSARFSPERQVPVNTSIGRGANPDCTTPY
jgi:hypothetical protein